ncbi:YkgJ family cysteine cluster protein [Halococcoides cellulosivorans]|uniref:YkgJ family cysteine cluster protein n=1 Tax=Halococcoides cellulosivorans TaxID=1679096 RepID=UPI001F3D445D|nr:YkgJ family cysteine cluster protein [Halococcoides cellulosivorans]
MSEVERTVDAVADAIEAIGFECTRCGHCCQGLDGDHTATVFPGEIRTIEERTDEDWNGIARPMPFGLTEGAGETFEWALQIDSCGDCTFGSFEDGEHRCAIYEDRPLICQTYPFSLAPEADADPPPGVVDREGPVRAHECEGLGREISREKAEALAETLIERTERERDEATGVGDNYRPTDADGVVVFDSEGPKRPDGTPLDDES